MEFQRLERELCLVLRIFKFHETWNSTREPKLELARIRLLKILKSLSKIAWKIIGQLIANIRETMQCERTSKRFLSFSIVQKFSCTRKKKNCTDFTTSRFYSRCTRGVIFATVTHFTLVPLWCLCINVFIRLFLFEVFIASFYSWNSSIYFEYSLVRFISFLVLLERI